MNNQFVATHIYVIRLKSEMYCTKKIRRIALSQAKGFYEDQSNFDELKLVYDCIVAINNVQYFHFIAYPVES